MLDNHSDNFFRSGKILFMKIERNVCDYDIEYMTGQLYVMREENYSYNKMK